MTTISRTDSPVTVGVDGSRFATAAVRIAAAEARMRHRRLRILHAVPWPDVDLPIHDDLRGPIENELRERGEAILAAAEAAAREVAPDLDITVEIRVDSSAAALIDASRHDELVVVGERGHGDVATLILGSTAHRVAAQAHGPVIIARGTPTPGGPVVVGIDGGPGTVSVVRAAYAEASMRGAALHAVHARHAPMILESEDIPPAHPAAGAVGQADAQLLDAALAGVREHYPHVPVTAILVRAPVRRTLLDHAEGAELLVVGTRTHHRLVSTPFGSVASAMVNHATCPVMLVPPTDRVESDAVGPDDPAVSDRAVRGGART